MRPITLGIGVSIAAMLVASCGSAPTQKTATKAKPAKSSPTTTNPPQHPSTTTTTSTTTTLPPATTPTTLRRTTTTQPRATTTTTLPRTTTTPPPLVASCADPSFSTNDAQGTNNTDPEDGFQYWWVNNDAWSGSHGPQSINACNQSSWYATSNQPNIGGQVETYPDTEYDVGGRNNPSTTPISGWHSITSTFSEAFPPAGGWDAAYDLWLNNWSTEIMIWNQWAGSQSFWPAQANGPGGFALTLDGVPYHFFDNGGELMFFRDAQVTSGSVDILAALQWLVANPNADNGLVKASDVPTQLEYGVEVSYTSGTETFPMTGLTFNVG